MAPGPQAPGPPVRWRSAAREIGGFYTFLKPEVEKLRAAEGMMRTHAMKQCDVLLKEYVSFNPYIQQLYFEHIKSKKFGDSRYPQAHRFSEIRPRFMSIWDSSPPAINRPNSRKSVRSTTPSEASYGYQSSEKTSSKIMSKTPKPERGRKKSPTGAEHRSDSRNPERSSQKSPELIRYRSPDSNPEQPRQGSPHRISEGSPHKYRKGNQYRVPEEALDRNMLSHRVDGSALERFTPARGLSSEEVSGEVVRFLVRPPEEESSVSSLRPVTAPDSFSTGAVSEPRRYNTTSRSDTPKSDSGVYRPKKPPKEVTTEPRSEDKSYSKIFESSRAESQLQKPPEGSPINSPAQGSSSPARAGGAQGETKRQPFRTSSREASRNSRSPPTQRPAEPRGRDRAEPAKSNQPPPQRSDANTDSASWSSQSPAGGSYRMPDLSPKLPEAKPSEGNVYVISDGNQYKASSGNRSLHHLEVGHLLHGSPSRTPEQERSRAKTAENEKPAPLQRRYK